MDEYDEIKERQLAEEFDNIAFNIEHGVMTKEEFLRMADVINRIHKLIKGNCPWPIFKLEIESHKITLLKLDKEVIERSYIKPVWGKITYNLVGFNMPIDEKVIERVKKEC